MKQPAGEWEAAATTELRSFLPPQADRKLDLPQAEIALRLARIQLARPQPDFAQADRLLARIFESLPAAETIPRGETAAASKLPPDPWKELQRSATTLRVVSLAGQGGGGLEQARELLQGLTTTSPADLLPILDGLSQVISSGGKQPQHSLGELQLTAALSLKQMSDRLDAAEKRHLDRCLAQAYVATGQAQRAVEIYEKLVQESPRDKDLLTALATQLLQCGTTACLQKGLATWRKLEGEQTAGTAPWLESRFEIAKCLMRLGQVEQALKLIGVTKLLYPQLGGEALKGKFAELEKECRERVKK